VDSQSVKSAVVKQAVGYDAGKQIKGRKRFLTVDTLGLILRVYVMAASVGEREGANKFSNEFTGWETQYLGCIPFGSMVGLMVNPLCSG